MVESIAGSSLLQLRSRKAKSEVAELERKIGQQTMENAVLRRCLQRVEEQQKLQALTMRGSSIPSSSKK
jgi:transposase